MSKYFLLALVSSSVFAAEPTPEEIETVSDKATSYMRCHLMTAENTKRHAELGELAYLSTKKAAALLMTTEKARKQLPPYITEENLVGMIYSDKLNNSWKWYQGKLEEISGEEHWFKIPKDSRTQYQADLYKNYNCNMF
ncbi:hypothetical protein JCM19239_1585 [Vibrio variabilis]|uniref:Uncharacterized protein n=1 Tax=Vibrio variabilis TaxID=990271 RepID=A0ABQ0JID7_9VIBR|nr:hypothetical protein JCM19239_1585 [Vibrio variabilis]